MDEARFASAVRAFEQINRQDPRQARDDDGSLWPAQLLDAQRLVRWVKRLDANPSEALLLAAHCQHLDRFSVPRSTFPAGRAGYKRWRSHLAKYHAEKAGEVLRAVGYPRDMVERVQAINLKVDIQGDPDTQMMEDALCLVFLRYQLDELAGKTAPVKMIDILRKTWRKMSDRARSLALSLEHSDSNRALLEQASKVAVTATKDSSS